MWKFDFQCDGEAMICFEGSKAKQAETGTGMKPLRNKELAMKYGTVQKMERNWKHLVIGGF